MTSRFLRSVFCVVPEFTDYQTGSRCLLPLPCVLHFNVEFSLLLPQIERIKSSDFEIELYPPSSIGLSLTHIQLEKTFADKASYMKFTAPEQVKRERLN